MVWDPWKHLHTKWGYHETEIIRKRWRLILNRASRTSFNVEVQNTWMKMFFQVRQTNTRTSAVRSDPNSHHNGQKATVHWTQDKSMFFNVFHIDNNWCSDFVNQQDLSVFWEFNSQSLEDTGPTPKATCLAAAIAWSSSFDQTRWPSMIRSTWYTSQ